MVKRCFDLCAALFALIVLGPLMALAAIGIRITDPGPILYRATRAGKQNRPFTMFKFRTMRVVQEQRSAITSANDNRIFAFGNLLRKLKIDELPQLFNVVRGEMSIVGPRPEAISIVERFYQPAHMETLSVLPGLASPGSIYNYTHGEAMIGDANPEVDYAEKLLPIKLALDLVYVNHASLGYDLAVIFRTLNVIVRIALGQAQFPDPPEFQEARGTHLHPITVNG